MNRFLKPIVETLHCNVSTALILLMLCCFHAPAFADLNTGLVAYWSFDDCSAKENKL
jgi:hypothetical protein